MMWTEVAWNGVRFKVPQEWVVGRIGRDYLLLESNANPVMEVKWAAVKGEFSHQRHIKKLAARRGRSLGRPLSACPLPAGWAKALSRYEVTGFGWADDAMEGKGVMLYCRTCGKATMIQFFHNSARADLSFVPQLLESFQDHRPDDLMLWSIFDIHALIPQAFQLKKHRLEAGLFELAFANGSERIALYRWGPASVLLAQQDLVQFAQNAAGIAPETMDSNYAADQNRMEWETAATSSRFSSLIAYVMQKPLHGRIRLWNVKDKNRILGVDMQSRFKVTAQDLEMICSRYGCI